MKIGYIARGPLDDRTLWSGIISYSADELKDRFEVVPVIIKDTFLSKIFTYATKALSFRKSNYSMWAIKSKKRYIEREINKAKAQGCKVFFAPAASDLIASGGVPEDCELIYFTDCTYHLMQGYYFDESIHDQKVNDTCERLALERADVVVHACIWAQRDAKTYYNIKQDKLNIAKFGANIADTYTEREYLEKENIKLLIVGVDWKRKGIDIAIDCLKQLNKKSDKYRFTLTVAGFEKPIDFDDENVIFAGRLNKNNPEQCKDLIELYKNSDIFILPTQAECTGIVFCEAAMHAMPSVTYDTGGVSDYVKNEETGILLPIGASATDFADAIVNILNDGKLKEYSENARRRYEEELNWKVWGNQLEKIIEKM